MNNAQIMVGLLVGLSGSPVVRYAEKPNGVNDNVIVYHVISETPDRNLSGTVREKTRFQLDCYGSTLDNAVALGNRVKNVLDCNTTNFPIGSFFVAGFFIKDVELNLYKNVLEFMIE